MAEAARVDWLKDRIVPWVTVFGVLVGVVVTALELPAISQNTKQRLRLETFEQTDRAVRDLNAARNQIRQLREMHPDIESFNAAVKGRLEAGESGSSVFNSSDADMTAFREFWRAWERLASYVHLGMIDWEVVYEVMPYPHEEWKDCSTVREMLADHWYGKGEPLHDFMLNMARLQLRYVERYGLDRTNDVTTEAVLRRLARVRGSE